MLGDFSKKKVNWIEPNRNWGNITSKKKKKRVWEHRVENQVMATLKIYGRDYGCVAAATTVEWSSAAEFLLLRKKPKLYCSNQKQQLLVNMLYNILFGIFYFLFILFSFWFGFFIYFFFQSGIKSCTPTWKPFLSDKRMQKQKKNTKNKNEILWNVVNMVLHKDMATSVNRMVVDKNNLNWYRSCCFFIIFMKFCSKTNFILI